MGSASTSLTLVEEAAGGLLQRLAKAGEVFARLKRILPVRGPVIEYHSRSDVGLTGAGDLGHARLDETVPSFVEHPYEVRVAPVDRAVGADDPVPLSVNDIVELVGDDLSEARAVLPKQEQRWERQVREQAFDDLVRLLVAG